MGRYSNSVSYAGRKASDKKTGQVRLATTAEVAAGTNDNVAISAKDAVAAIAVVDTAVDAVAQLATVTVSTAELLALATTPKELVAAPGADKYIEFLGAQFILNYATTQYTEAGDNMGIKYTDASGVQVSSTVECTGFIDQAADTITSAIPVGDAIVAASAAVNKALVLDNLNANFAAGDSEMFVQIRYKIITAGL